MNLFKNYSFLNKHAFLRLHLSHAAVGNWPCNNVGQKNVNILFSIIECEENDDSFIRDIECNQILKLKKNCSYFLPYQRKLHWNLSNNLKFVSIHFNMDFFYGFDIFQKYPECITFENSNFISSLLQVSQEKIELPIICKINSIIYQLADELLQKHPIQHNINTNIFERYKTVIEYVQKECNAQTKVTNLATLMNMRSDVFSRTFTHDLGITPKEFIINVLLRKSSDLLLDSQNSIRVVAKQLKFSSEYYFSTFFKNQTGQSPKEFKKRNIVNGY